MATRSLMPMERRLGRAISTYFGLDIHLLEVGAGSDDLVYKIFDGEDVIFSESLFNDTVVGERDALLVDLAVATLVDEFTDGLQVGLAICHEKLNQRQEK